MAVIETASVERVEAARLYVELEKVTATKAAALARIIEAVSKAPPEMHDFLREQIAEATQALLAPPAVDAPLLGVGDDLEVLPDG